MIECTSITGAKKSFPKDRLNLRVSVYGLAMDQGKILLVGSRHNPNLFPPGGGVETGETLHEALSREIEEETGLEVEIKKFVDFKETFFYYDPLDAAFHNFAFFYLCRPKFTNLIANDQIKDADAENPRWVDIKTPKKEQLNTPADELFDYITNYKEEE